MKIKEVLLKEFDDGGFNPMGDVTTGMPSASPTAVAAPAPAQAGQAKWPTTKAEIIAFQKANKLKPDGLIGKNTMAALQKAGATPPPGFNPVGPKAAKAPAAKAPASKPAADPNQAAIDASNAANQQAVQQQKQNYAQADAATAPDRFAGQAKTDAQTGQNNLGVEEPRQADSHSTVQGPAATGQDAPSAELDRLKQLAIGQNTLNQQASQQGAAMAQAAQSNTPAPNTNALGIANANTTVSPFGGPAPQADNPNPPPGQAAQPAQNPDTVAPVVKTGTGGTLTTRDGKPVTSRSNDEIAWAQSHPYQPYPGPGWQEKQKAQGEKNAAALKGFFNKINPFAKKEQPAGQGGQPTTPPPPAPGQFSEETNTLRKLAGLK